MRIWDLAASSAKPIELRMKDDVLDAVEVLARASSAKPIELRMKEDEVDTVAFSPNGLRLVVGCSNDYSLVFFGNLEVRRVGGGVVSVWDVQQPLSDPIELGTKKDMVRAVAFGPDRNSIFIATRGWGHLVNLEGRNSKPLASHLLPGVFPSSSSGLSLSPAIQRQITSGCLARRRLDPPDVAGLRQLRQRSNPG